jgi:hypothetical protein
MAKKDKKKKDTKSAETDPVAALRSAFERTLSASAEGAQATRERTREIVDELAAAAGRVRSTLEDMRVLDEVKRLRAEVESLAARVASLELPRTGGAAKAAPAKPAAAAPATPAKKPAVKRGRPKTTAAAKKPPAVKPAIPVKRAAAARKRPVTAKKPAAVTTKKPAAAKLKPAATEPKPPATSGTS